MVAAAAKTEVFMVTERSGETGFRAKETQLSQLKDGRQRVRLVVSE